MVYVLGIDGGGTKTVALAADFRGNVLGRGTSRASNYQTVGLDRAIAALKEASEAAMAAAGIARFEVACFGLAGVGRKSDRDLLMPEIEELGLADEIILEHDAAIALAGATAGQPGVVVLAGTGAMAFGINSSGETRRAGGWGNVLADEGSAYYIGRRSLAAACRAYDGRGNETALVSKLMEHFGLDHFTDIVRKIYKEEASPQKIASLAPLVSQLAKVGDRVAIEILKDAAEELALAARAVIKGLNMEDEEFQVAASGSVFKAGELLLTPFAESVKSTAPRAEVIPPRFKPAMGAVFLALNAAGADLSEALATD
jgi:N-acetylglucosamine kinase-like BadF-type ATPase